MCPVLQRIVLLRCLEHYHYWLCTVLYCMLQNVEYVQYNSNPKTCGRLCSYLIWLRCLPRKKTVTTLNILMKIDDSDKQFVSLGAKTASNHRVQPLHTHTYKQAEIRRHITDCSQLVPCLFGHNIISMWPEAGHRMTRGNYAVFLNYVRGYCEWKRISLCTVDVMHIYINQCSTDGVVTVLSNSL